MTHRDVAWRGLGLALFGAGSAVALLRGPVEEGSVAGLAAFLLALVGLVLIVQGKRVPAAFRVERSRHKALPQTIHTRRASHARRAQRMDDRNG